MQSVWQDSLRNLSQPFVLTDYLWRQFENVMTKRGLLLLYLFERDVDGCAGLHELRPAIARHAMPLSQVLHLVPTGVRRIVRVSVHPAQLEMNLAVISKILVLAELLGMNEGAAHEITPLPCCIPRLAWPASSIEDHGVDE